MRDFTYTKSAKGTYNLNDNFAETYNAIYDVVITAYQNVRNRKQKTATRPTHPHLYIPPL
jgi:hypothetical protein